MFRAGLGQKKSLETPVIKLLREFRAYFINLKL